MIGEKIKLVITDLDGTLFDTKDVNYHAYRDAIAPYGYSIDYQYYCDYCNGRHYTNFLPQITTDDMVVLEEMHAAKKAAYARHLDKARLNYGLVAILRAVKAECPIALITTASTKNCTEIVEQFHLGSLFDLIMAREDVVKTKPNPEGFLKAMEYFGVTPKETIIFEDSEPGLLAAERSGALHYKTYGFN